MAEGGLLRITKDTFITLITQEIPRVLFALYQEWDEDQIYNSYSKSQHHSAYVKDVIYLKWENGMHTYLDTKQNHKHSFSEQPGVAEMDS